MRASDLIRDAGTGLLSHTKLWANIAYAVATLAFLHQEFFTQLPPSTDIWLIYLAVIGGHCAVSKLISLRAPAAVAEPVISGAPLAAYRDDPRG